MYDTVEIPLVPGARFTDRIRSVKTAVEGARDPLKSEIPFRSNLYYSQVVDLRKIEDIDAVLHLNARKTDTHKIQIVEAGKKCAGEIYGVVSRIVETDPREHEVSRVDTCADIVDGPEVRWLAQCVRARSAQWQSQFGTVRLRDSENKRMQWSEMGKRAVGTMYIGMRPNCFRVYDKLAERRQAWNRELHRHERLASLIVADNVIDGTAHNYAHSETYKKWRAGIAKDVASSAREYFPFPGFESWFADQCRGPMSNIGELPKSMTRVERQMGAGRIPERLNNFEKLFSTKALDFNPFDRLDFSPFDAQRELEVCSDGDFLYRCPMGERCYQCRHVHESGGCCEHETPRGYCDCPCRPNGELCNGCHHVHVGNVRCDVEVIDVCRCEGVRYTIVDYAAGFQMKHWIETDQMTYQQLYAALNRKRNGKRLTHKFRPFIASAIPRDAVSISSAQLFEHYRNSLTRQMAA